MHKPLKNSTMSQLSESLTLSNGVKIPKIGFGTWQIDNDDAFDAVASALHAGYRHIDTARAYGNEQNVGKAIKDSKLKREEFFITTKLPAEKKGYDEALTCFEKSTTSLGTPFLDLYLIHAPWPWNQRGLDCTPGNIASWKGMEKLYKEGKIRSIGVSNFSITDIKAIIDNCEIVPHVNQISVYIGHTQDELREFCREQKILVEAYSPLATGGALRSEVIRKVAKGYNVSPAQICIRYVLQKELVALPKSTHPERILENTKVDFTIKDEDMALLDAIKEDFRRF
jgi:diketogulonate reductase-like aldo/keto reductase